jgi:hypothetical protein
MTKLNIKKAITHHGASHRDEFLGACLLLATFPEIIIHRMEPENSHKDDPEVLVFDVGGLHEPDKLNFDHHQFSRDEEPCSALKLLNEHFGWGLEMYAWYDATNILDSKGPKAFAEYVTGDSSIDLLPTISPVEQSMKQMFGSAMWVDNNNPEDTLAIMMKAIGRNLIDYVAEIEFELRQMKDAVKFHRVGPEGYVAVFPLDKDFKPKSKEIFIQESGLEVIATASKSIRTNVVRPEEGTISLFRRDDDLVDFAHIKDHADVSFVHASGFCAAANTGADYIELIKQSMVEPKAPECKTPGTNFHLKTEGNKVQYEVILPEGKDITEELSKTLEDGLHDVTEKVLSKAF